MRLFVALETPAEIQRELDRRCREARPELPKARWVKLEAMHLTLVFLGETDPERPALDRELRAAFAGGEPMELRIGALGAFPPRGKRRVVWAGIEADGDLEGLHRRVATAVQRAVGLEPDGRPYRPHLTLARCKPPWPASAVERLISAFGPEPVGAYTVDHGCLISSQLHPAGARYKTVETYPLAGAS